MTQEDNTSDNGTEAEGDRGPPTHAERLAQFAERLESFRVFSTGAAVVSHTGALYNVKNSNPDPKIDS